MSKIADDAQAFAKVSASLPAAEAAAQWLALADRFGALPWEAIFAANQSSQNYNDRFSFQKILDVLPPPTAWEAITKAVEARADSVDAAGLHTIYLRVIAHWLGNDRAAAKVDLQALSALTEKMSPRQRLYRQRMNQQLKTAWLAGSDDGAAILENLGEALRLFVSEAEQMEDSGGRSFRVPDLVRLVGEKEAAKFLSKALAADRLQLEINQGLETQKLARKLALELGPSLKMPQWSLAEAMDAVPLYEAMAKRFPAPKKQPGNDDPDGRTTASQYYLGGLLAAHRRGEAMKLATDLGQSGSLPSEAREALEKAGMNPELIAFFHDLLQVNPDLPYWDDYVRLAVLGEKTPEMIALAKASAARPGVVGKPRRALYHILRSAYLAADQVEEGVAVFRQEIALAAAQVPSNEESEYPVEDLGLEFTRLGQLLQRPDLVEEGIAATRTSLAAPAPAGQRSGLPRRQQSLAALFLELDRGPEAEALLASAWSGVQPGDVDQGRSILMSLVALYHRAGRSADVLALLERAPLWGAADLAEIYRESITTRRNEDRLGYFAASALAAEKRTAEARPILDAVLNDDGSYDPAFELLTQLEPAAALPRLDALFARDPYEERPLIWKAKLLLAAGQLEEAEKVARQAVAVDPSDGEQGPGRRMRVYSVLADIREARGDAKEAATFRGAVTAIRHSEEADRFFEAGLLTRAVAMYQEALTHFADAYCIQSRLALRMMDLGDIAGAEEHYRRAYELMPGSFGRVESHCFGCERAFAGQRAQSLAERVFTQIAARQPENPQVHYLLGYLREEEERPLDALPEYRQAVQRDPAYLNAWKKLGALAADARLSSSERDSIQLNLLRLDPLQRHASLDADRVSDQRALWSALEQAGKSQLPPPTTLYPLAASADAMESAIKVARNGRGRFQPSFLSRSSFAAAKAPGSIIAKTDFLESVSTGFDPAQDPFQ